MGQAVAAGASRSQDVERARLTTVAAQEAEARVDVRYGLGDCRLVLHSGWRKRWPLGGQLHEKGLAGRHVEGVDGAKQQAQRHDLLDVDGSGEHESSQDQRLRERRGEPASGGDSSDRPARPQTVQAESPTRCRCSQSTRILNSMLAYQSHPVGSRLGLSTDD